ncbi:MAG: hypothetical protein WCG45_03380 [bacterium]
MKTQTNIQAISLAKHLAYILNPESNYYEKVRGERNFTKVPIELKVEKNKGENLIKSDFIIHGGNGNENYSFITGIIHTKFKNWFFSDYFEIIKGSKRNSFILFHFLPKIETLEIYFFNHFKLYPKRRGYFIRDFKTSLIQ